MLCRMVKLRRALLYFAVVFVLLVGLAYVAWPRHVATKGPVISSCSNEQSKLYLEELVSLCVVPDQMRMPVLTPAR